MNQKRFSHQKRTDLHFYATILFAAAAYDSAAKSFHPLMIAAAAAAAGAISAAISMRWPRNSQYAITDRIDLHIEKLLQSQREQEKRIQVAEDNDHSKITKKAFSRAKKAVKGVNLEVVHKTESRWKMHHLVEQDRTAIAFTNDNDAPETK
jgi:hypothetical protein